MDPAPVGRGSVTAWRRVPHRPEAVRRERRLRATAAGEGSGETGPGSAADGLRRRGRRDGLLRAVDGLVDVDDAVVGDAVRVGAVPVLVQDHAVVALGDTDEGVEGRDGDDVVLVDPVEAGDGQNRAAVAGADPGRLVGAVVAPQQQGAEQQREQRGDQPSAGDPGRERGPNAEDREREHVRVQAARPRRCRSRPGRGDPGRTCSGAPRATRGWPGAELEGVEAEVELRRERRHRVPPASAAFAVTCGSSESV